ncbi:MAG: dihydroorotase [Thermomicrobiales bacterium]|jgi:dihydroorotase
MSGEPRTLLLRGGRILDPASGRDEIGDLLLRDGRVAAAGGRLAAPPDAEVLDVAGAVVTPGWIDLHCHLREPGFEYKETIQGGAAAAAQGGFTTVCCMPNTNPPPDTPERVADLYARARGAAVRVLPIATITQGRKLLEPVDYAALAAAGAIGFSDDGDSTRSSAAMRAALAASRELRRPVMVHCEDPDLVRGGALNDGAVSRALGLPGSPGVAEDVMLARDLTIAGDTGGWLYACHVTTAASVQLIREAKARGVQVTAEATPHHLALTDDWVGGDRRFYWERATSATPPGQPADPNTKVNPPLRTGADVEALAAGVRDGTIDTIGTDHAPHAPRDKGNDYRVAAFGMLAFEVALPSLLTAVRAGALGLPTVITKLTAAPAAVLGDLLPRGAGTLAVGTPADVTVFDPEREWTAMPEALRSTSKNTPLLHLRLRGQVTLTIVGGHVRYRS